MNTNLIPMYISRKQKVENIYIFLANISVTNLTP